MRDIVGMGEWVSGGSLYVEGMMMMMMDEEVQVDRRRACIGDVVGLSCESFWVLPTTISISLEYLLESILVYCYCYHYYHDAHPQSNLF